MKSSVDIFNRDALFKGGYRYTTGAQLSCRMATQRTLDAILKTEAIAGRSVLDIACGDGHYTIRLWDSGHPRALTAVDAAEHSVNVARLNIADRPIRCVVADARSLPWPDNSFDLVLIQSVLHHVDYQCEIIREAFRLAPRILIHEPNGNNFGVKIIEKVSPYHREHREKSYTSHQLRRWIEQAGGKVSSVKFAGFVPIFCPDWLARVMKKIEPLIEYTPFLNACGCAVVVLVAAREDR
ncbi:MAG: class I SAM-dependent methyltransferase [Candidatus Aureabacteria bacterium]|nr:class I SAM-dependent methyltransferase [Candidatus Auribacterota bacterium]